MPFVTQDRRKIIDEFGLDEAKLPNGVMVGDICYYYYKPMVERWKASPRWTTAHEIWRDMFRMPIGSITDDQIAAKELAWQVFFNLYVMPYELKKREENGDI